MLSYFLLRKNKYVTQSEMYEEMLKLTPEEVSSFVTEIEYDKRSKEYDETCFRFAQKCINSL
jgi:hypothetical protein